MKSKILFSILVCCLLGVKISAQCTANLAYQQTAGSPAIYFYTDSIQRDTLLINSAVYTWSFGDGTGGSGSSISHQFPPVGWSYYYVCLTKHDTVSGCTSTTCDTVYAFGGSCSVSIAYTNQDSFYTFAPTTTGVAPLSYNWTENSTTVASTDSLSQVMQNAYTEICLTITDAQGCIANTCINVFDSVNGPRCSTTVSYSNMDSQYHFIFAHTGAGPVNYEWTLNGSPVSSMSDYYPVLDLSITNVVCVTVTDQNGCSSSDCATIAGTAGACHAFFQMFADTSATGTTGSYYGYNYSSGGYGSNLLWSFGDGTTSTDPYPSHTYAQPGLYDLCLTVGVAGTSCYDTYCDSSFYVNRALMLMSSMTILSPTGIQTLAPGTPVSLYPNPVNNELNIATSQKIDQQRIINIEGQIVFDTKSARKTIDVSAYSPGIYILELNSNGAISRTKFVKQ